MGLHPWEPLTSGSVKYESQLDLVVAEKHKYESQLDLVVAEKHKYESQLDLVVEG